MSRNRPLSVKQKSQFDQNDKEKIQSYVNENTPFEILRGDTIKIDRVEVKIIGSPLEHLHDREVREAYLAVFRAGGCVAKPSVPIVYTGVTSVMDYDIASDNFQTITKRILAHFKLSYLHEMQSVENDSSHAYIALRKAFAVAAANKCLDGLSYNDDYKKTVVKVRQPGEEFHDGTNICYTINDAMMMGYLWAMHEVDPAIKEYAKQKRQKEIKSKENARKRGKASGEIGILKNNARQAVVNKIAGDLWNLDASTPKAQIIRTISGKSIARVRLPGGKKLWEKTVEELGLSSDLQCPEFGTLDTLVTNFSKGRFPVKKSRPPKG